MKLELKKVTDAITNVKVTFETEEWIKAQDSAYEKLAKDIEVKGFRKGEAPLVVAKKHIDTSKAMSTALDIIIPTGFKKILAENKLEVLIQPAVNVEEISADKLVVMYTFTARPEVKLGTYKGIKIKKEEVKVTEEDINAELNGLALKLATLSEKKGDKVEKGDIVNFDFEGYTDGKAFEGGAAENYELEVGSNMFIPGFEDQLIGKKVGERCEIKVKFPENYVKELAGKDATFKIFIHSIKVKNIPAIDDELAKDAQIKGVETLAQLKETIKKAVSAKKAADADKLGFNLLVQQIVKGSKLTVPETVIARDLDFAFRNFVKGVEDKGIPFQKYCEVSGDSEAKIKERLKGEVEENLKAVFVLSEIAKENKIVVEAKDVDEELDKIAKQYNVDLETVKKTFENNMGELTNRLFTRKIGEYLRSVNTVE